MNIETLGNELLSSIKKASFFPYKTGRLRDKATRGDLYTPNVYRIQFSEKVAPYVVYLEEGTSPHDIPRAFGRPLPFGIGGRFDGKFHPGSKKHKDFIKIKTMNHIISYICTKYKGELR